MAKRFLDTEFFRSPFVRSLQGASKMLYLYVICDCNGAGVWVKDLDIAGVYTGFKYSENDFSVFVKTGKAIDLGNGKYFFPDFLEHQYPNGLQANNPSHRNFISELQKYLLLDDALKVLRRPSKGSKVMVTGIGNGNSGGNGIGNPLPEINELVFPFDSVNFMSAWSILLESKKWKKKKATALQMSLKKLAGYCEADAIRMIENCIAGEWQGLVDLKPHERTQPETAMLFGKVTVDQYKNQQEYLKSLDDAAANNQRIEGH